MGVQRTGTNPEDLLLTWGGHATVLIELDGVRLVTDPVLRGRVVHLRRHAPDPGDALIENVDAVLISHLHFDHLDIPTLKRYARDVKIIVPDGAGPMIKKHGFRDVVELLEGEATEVGPVTVLAVPADHDGRRHPFGLEVEAIGFVVEGNSRRLLFAGDTDLHPRMDELTGTLEVALLPIWGWGHKLGPGHMDPRGAARAAATLRPELTVPIHWGTYFPIGMKGIRGALLEKPVRAFQQQMGELAPDLEVAVLSPGESLVRPERPEASS